MADVLGLPLETDDRIVSGIEQRFARRGLTMPAVNRRQAQVPRGAIVLDNPNGTAPGLLIARDRQLIVLLPGPPRELKPMFDALCDGPLLERAGSERLYRARLFVDGPSRIARRGGVQPIYARGATRMPPIATTILASPGQVELHLTLRDSDAGRALARLARARDELHRAARAPTSSAPTAGRWKRSSASMLVARGYTIAAAESCTGRPADVAADGRARQFRLRARSGRELQQRGEDRSRSTCPPR